MKKMRDQSPVEAAGSEIFFAIKGAADPTKTFGASGIGIDADAQRGNDDTRIDISDHGGAWSHKAEQSPGEQQAKAAVVPSEADDGSNETTASVLQTIIRTFFESLVWCGEWTEEESCCVRAARVLNTGSLLGSTMRGESLVASTTGFAPSAVNT